MSDHTRGWRHDRLQADSLVHPYAPAGGCGGGAARRLWSYGLEDPLQLHPDAPAARFVASHTESVVGQHGKPQQFARHLAQLETALAASSEGFRDVLPDESLKAAYDLHADWIKRRHGLSKVGGTTEFRENNLLQWLRESVGWVDPQLLAAVPDKPFFRPAVTGERGSDAGRTALLTSSDSLVARVFEAARSSVEEQWSQAVRSGARQQDELLRTWKRRIEYVSQRTVARSAGTGEEKVVQPRRPVRVAETPSASVQPQKTWVEFQLVDDTGEPVPNAAYKVRLPDGSQMTGTLNAQGKVRFESIDPGQCQISFPDIHGSELRSA